MEFELKRRFDMNENSGQEEFPRTKQAEHSVHSKTLLVHWELYSRTHQWKSALTISEGLIESMPEEPIGWLYRGFALKQLGRTREALNGLVQASKRFPKDWRIAYNAACCASRLGDIAGTWNWLDLAVEVGDADVVKSAALDDPNLRSLWSRIGQI